MLIDIYSINISYLTLRKRYSSLKLSEILWLDLILKDYLDLRSYCLKLINLNF